MKSVKKSSKKYPTKKSLANLKPVTMRSKEEARAISSKGGKGNKDNPKSKLAARLREMRKNGLTTEAEQWLHDMMTDNEMAAFHILKKIKELWNGNDKQDINLAVKTTMDWYKIKHGTAESNKKIDINIQLLKPEERELEVLRLIGEDDVVKLEL